jgi:hypothetical protein
MSTSSFDVDQHFTYVSYPAAVPFERSICLDLVRKPIQLSCGHMFCRRRCYEPAAHQPCPLCTVPRSETKPALAVVDFLSNCVNLVCNHCNCAVVISDCRRHHDRECEGSASTLPILTFTPMDTLYPRSTRCGHQTTPDRVSSTSMSECAVLEGGECRWGTD